MTTTRKGILAAGFAAALAAVAGSAGAQTTEGWLARQTAKEYRDLARYPESSRPLKAGDADPVKAKRTASVQTAPGPDGKGPVLAVWASKVSYEPGQPVELYARLEKLVGKGGSPAKVASLSGEVADGEGAVIARFEYRDDGAGGDRKARDGVYSARVELPKGLGEAPGATSYQVRARARLSDGDLREAFGGFLASRPSAHLTGRYRDELRDGDVVVAAEVEVVQGGRFHLAGTLYDADGQGLGVAQGAASLEPGRHWIELTYYGLMFRERQAEGPFRLGSLALATTTSMPNALNDLVENAYLTRRYRLESLRSAPFGEVKLLEAARRLDAEAERAGGRETPRQ